jgi:hypothetical protein
MTATGTRTATLATVVTGALVAMALSACGDSEPTSAEAASAETATMVCGMLRRWNNEFSDSFNDTSDTITDQDDPDTANDVLADGLDQLIAIAEDHVAEVDGSLMLPPTAERERLLDELRSGADEAVAAIEAEREKAADLPPITVDDQRGAIGGALLALERAGSVVEPAIGSYDAEELREAFAAEDGCEHVIQPF